MACLERTEQLDIGDRRLYFSQAFGVGRDGQSIQCSETMQKVGTPINSTPGVHEWSRRVLVRARCRAKPKRRQRAPRHANACLATVRPEAGTGQRPAGPTVSIPEPIPIVNTFGTRWGSMNERS